MTFGFDDDAGAGEDPEVIFAAPVLDDYYIGISGEGNAAYNPVDATGAVAGAIGGVEVIIHRNPTQIGSSLGNLLNGSEAANYIVSLAGNDTVSGGDGRDTLAGGDENDQISGGNGADQIYGEQGNDVLNGDNGLDVVSGGLGNDTIDGGRGGDVLSGGVGDDSLSSGIGFFVDTLRGDEGRDVLLGGRAMT